MRVKLHPKSHEYELPDGRRLKYKHVNVESLRFTLWLVEQHVWTGVQGSIAAQLTVTYYGTRRAVPHYLKLQKIVIDSQLPFPF